MTMAVNRAGEGELMCPVDGAPGYWIESLRGVVICGLQGQKMAACYLSERVGARFVTDAIEDIENCMNAKNLQWKIVGAEAMANVVSNWLRQSNRSVVKVAVASPGTQILLYPHEGRILVEKNARKIRVMIVDDSVTIQKLLTKIVSSDPQMEVVATASKPSEALELIEKAKPDVLTMDIHMPEMNGVELVRKVFPQYRLPIVMISSVTPEDGTFVLEAMEAGAVDYIKKPEFNELGEMASVIVDKIKAATRANLLVTMERAIPEPRVELGLDQSQMIAIGSSTGGTEALRQVLTRLPRHIPPIVIAQHIPAVFSKALAERLNSMVPFQVKEAEDGEVIRPDVAYIAPGGRQMRIVRDNKGLKLKITDDEPVNRHKPSVDYLFDSVASEVGGNAVGVILTGMGADGAQGLLKMRKAGARTIAQDEESSIVFGMPKSAIKLGAVDKVAGLLQIAGVITGWLKKNECA